MLIVTGKVLNVVEKEPYKNKAGVEVEQMELDIKADEERWPQTVSGDPKSFKGVKVGDKVSCKVAQFIGAKDGRAYSVNRLIEIVRS